MTFLYGVYSLIQLLRAEVEVQKLRIVAALLHRHNALNLSESDTSVSTLAAILHVVGFRLFDQCDSCVNLPKAAMTFGKRIVFLKVISTILSDFVL